MAFLTHTNQTILPSSFAVAFVTFLLYHYIRIQKYILRASGYICYDFDVKQDNVSIPKKSLVHILNISYHEQVKWKLVKRTIFSD